VIAQYGHQSHTRKLIDFFDAFGVEVGTIDEPVSNEQDGLSLTLIEEEHDEVLDSWDKTIEEHAQELGDSVYVAYYRAVLLGVDLDKVIAEIHRANMSKIQPDGSVLRRADGKVMKGPMFVPANIKLVLDQQRTDNRRPAVPNTEEI
jgi:NTP pyrophosphatase (non-canonical NTP hydrolase)